MSSRKRVTSSATFFVVSIFICSWYAIGIIRVFEKHAGPQSTKITNFSKSDTLVKINSEDVSGKKQVNKWKQAHLFLPKGKHFTDNDEENMLNRTGKKKSPAIANTISRVSSSSCRALFSIMQVPSEEFFVGKHDLNTTVLNITSDLSIFPNFYYAVRSPTTDVNRDLNLARPVVRRLLLKKRRPSTILLTQEYYKLSLLLPRLMVYGNGKPFRDKDNERDGKSDALSTLLVGKSSITSAGGMLPYVPCAIAYYDQPLAVATCLKRRIQTKGSFWIQFLGDSKIRNLFFGLLSMLDNHYHFTLRYNASEETFADLDQEIIMDYPFYAFEALTHIEPRLRIIFNCTTLDENIPSEIKDIKEVTQLEKWASGEEKSPNLLIVGYSSWMFNSSYDDKVIRHEFLDLLRDVHRVIISLLEKISKRTRVLLVPQSRSRRVQNPVAILQNHDLSDTLLDWNESIFLRELLMFRETSPSSRKTSSSDVRDYTTLTEEQQNSVNGLQDENPPEGKKARLNSSKKSVTKLNSRPFQSGPPATDKTLFHDHLEPTSRDSGLWWWDSSLPLDLAGSSECQQLEFRNSSHPLDDSVEHRCFDDVHTGDIANKDMAVMLLNLMCNSVLGSQGDFCCS